MYVCLCVCIRAKVPDDEICLEEELVSCLMVMMNKPQGLTTLDASSGLIPVLAVRILQVM